MVISQFWARLAPGLYLGDKIAKSIGTSPR